MFKKLLSNLAFNPSLIGEVSFYAKRLHGETAIRRAGVLLLAFGFFIQTFAVLSPPDSSLQASPGNDLIIGGISSREDATQHCNKNTQNYKTILAHYGITCADLGTTKTVTLKSTDYNNKLFSMGHLQYGKPGETPVTIGTETLWLRPLSSWDTGKYSTYTALQGKTKAGTDFFILYSCGNLTFIGIPKPVPPAKPSFTVVKSVREFGTTGAFNQDVTVKPGGRVEFQITVTNTGNVDLAATNIKDVLPTDLKAVPGSLAVDNVKLSALLAGFNAGPLKVKQSKRITFAATVDPKVQACAKNRLKNVVTVTTNGLPPLQDDATVQACQPVQTPTPTLPNPPAPTVPAETPPPVNTPQTCDTSTCLTFKKFARNVTQNIANADNTTAAPGDTIQYILRVENIGRSQVSDFVVQENMSDVLDYADIVDLKGGTIDERKNVSWPAQTIASNQVIQQEIIVRIKANIPNTPTPPGDPGHFDLTMVNSYGNTITIKLPQTTIKTAEAVTETLPNTGPGESLAAVFLLTVIASYFFARTRLITKELDIVRTDFAATKGA